MRAKIDISKGMWPAWWTLGVNKPWPGNGEIDIMEYYRGKLLANIACLGTDRKAYWFSNTYKTDSLGGDAWANQFHTWRMDWTEEFIALYCDDVLLNKVNLDELVNKDGSGFNPFRQPHYMLLNFALGGMNGGDPSSTAFPRKFEIDYVRVYQKNKTRWVLKPLPLIVIFLFNIMAAFSQNRQPVFRENVDLDSILLSDPFILADKNTSTYYMTGTGGLLWKSKDLRKWTGPFVVTKTDSASWMGARPMIWAAELHHYNEQYYYFATFTNRNVNIDTVKEMLSNAVHVMCW